MGKGRVVQVVEWYRKRSTSGKEWKLRGEFETVLGPIS